MGTADQVPRGDSAGQSHRCGLRSGAKYHIPSNVPYARYFLARVLEFQFHRALCQAAGYQGPLYQVLDLWESGRGRQDESDASSLVRRSRGPKHWTRLQVPKSMDGAAMLDYYAPLMNFLKEQTKSQKCGW